jgi:hypothetical protein
MMHQVHVLFTLSCSASRNRVYFWNFVYLLHDVSFFIAFFSNSLCFWMKDANVWQFLDSVELQGYSSSKMTSYSRNSANNNENRESYEENMYVLVNT